MGEPFRVRSRIRFAHCDPAGIAYYPRYFELCDGAIEDWTEAVLVPRRLLHLELGLALPTVDLHATFRAPSRLGDWLDIAIVVHCVGRTSLQLSTVAHCGEEERFSTRYTQVLMRMSDARPVPWPEEWRMRIETALTFNQHAPSGGLEGEMVG
jgi:4-hydroxybenzoyl-CoA thioesterase